MSLNFLLGLGSLAYLSTQGHKKKRHSASAVPSRFGTGDRAYANAMMITRMQITLPVFGDGGVMTSSGNIPSGHTLEPTSAPSTSSVPDMDKQKFI